MCTCGLLNHPYSSSISYTCDTVSLSVNHRTHIPSPHPPQIRFFLLTTCKSITLRGLQVLCRFTSLIMICFEWCHQPTHTHTHTHTHNLHTHTRKRMLHTHSAQKFAFLSYESSKRSLLKPYCVCPMIKKLNGVSKL